MKVFTFLALVASSCAFSGVERRHPGDYYTQKFGEWKEQHGKSYSSAEAEAAALTKFADNDEIIERHNALGLNYWLGHNEFSDLSKDEFYRMYTGLVAPRQSNKRVMVKTGKSDIPDSIDWVAKGAVTPVKNQGQCGSCWAFSTTGSLEGAYQIANGKLVSFSEEDLVQCDKVDQGCNGGLMDNAFKWIKSNGGIAAESAYPYTSGTGTRGTCKKSAEPVATLTGFTDVPSKDEDALAEAVAKGPVSVAIEADKSVFQLYKGGVLDNKKCGTNLDHGVLTVGYGADSSGTKYWKVKNSWGATWGEKGYIRMARGVNQCGIAQQPSYPTGAKPVGPGPAPGPGPSPPPPTPSASHYEDPASGGCMADEQDIQIQGITGDFCSPACTGIFKLKCPSDVPAGVTATPQCALKDASSGAKYCALICSPTATIKDQKAADAQCGTNASCKSIQGVGICTYDD